jgi:hypothetical protein
MSNDYRMGNNKFWLYTAGRRTPTRRSRPRGTCGVPKDSMTNLETIQNEEFNFIISILRPITPPMNFQNLRTSHQRRARSPTAGHGRTAGGDARAA